MTDWSFLERVLGQVNEHSTGVGKVWLTVLFIFRVMVLCSAAETAWDDEQSEFLCNTLQPGCQLVCYDLSFPISHYRYFVLQIIFVSTPTLIYLGHLAIRASRKKKEQQENGVEGNEEAVGYGESKRDMQEHEFQNVPKLKGALMITYTISIVCKVILEAGFMLGMWFLYGFFIQPRYECQGFPCPYKVDCFVSRPTEKTIFTIYMQVLALISLVLNVIELFHLLGKTMVRRAIKYYEKQNAFQVYKRPVVYEPTLNYMENAQLCLPMASASNHSHFSDPNINFKPQESGMDSERNDRQQRNIESKSDQLPGYPGYQEEHNEKEMSSGRLTDSSEGQRRHYV
ncbi:gap junction protein alpha 4 [Polypterus senegalus]